MYEKLSESVYFIQPRSYDSNSILIKEDITFLVDTGTGIFFSELEKDLEAIGVKASEVQAVVNTHCHSDHVGGNHFFNCPAFAHKEDVDAIASGDPAKTVSPLFSLSIPKSSPQPLAQEFHGWKVLHTPGHTPGSICLYKKPFLISGDTLFPDGYGRTDLPGGNQEQIIDSLELLEKLDYETLLPGHGPRILKEFVPKFSRMI